MVGKTRLTAAVPDRANSIAQAIAATTTLTPAAIPAARGQRP